MRANSSPQPDQLRHTLNARVYKKGELAASISRLPTGELSFRYHEEYLAKQLPAVATTLPLSTEEVITGSGSLPNFFSGLLPEGQRLQVLRQAVKTSMDDELSLLLAVGQDTPGDVQVVPEGEALSPPPALVEGDNWADLSFADLAHQLDLVALPGVQAKVSAAMLSAPIRNSSGHYIIKFDPPSHRHLVHNEYLHLQAAATLRIPVAKAQLIHDSSGAQALLVHRFDRVRKRKKITRLAQEDATQVLNIPPADKYLVATEEVCLALMAHTGAPLVAARNLYLQFLFAWLTGNGDLHAKNVAILENPHGEFAIAPMYDLPCTLIYGDDTMALSVAGKHKNLRKRHWDELAHTLGLPVKAAERLQQQALDAAAQVELDELGITGSPLNGTKRELRMRRYEFA